MYASFDNLTNNLREQCSTFLEEITLSQKEREEIQIKTLSQRKSKYTYNEIKIRITFSNFGRICKTKDTFSRCKIAQTLRDNNIVKTAAISHGIYPKQKTINEYLKLKTS